MRNNFHYGFGARLTAVVLTMLMVLSLSGLTLRDEGMGVDEPVIFDESYGTPAPEATELPAESTPAQEATEAPAEDTPVPADTPAPETTEAPAEATPVPETDSGTDTDTNTDTSEPETTADPQDTPAPEGDTPADMSLTDGPATIAASKLSANLAFNSKGTDGKYTYTLTLNNVEGEYSTPIDNAVQFESASQYSGISGYTQAKIKSVSGAGAEMNGDRQVKVTGSITQVTITFTVTPTDGNAPVFGIKFSSSLISPGVQLVCTADETGNISTVKKYIKIDAAEGEKNADLPAGMTFTPSVSGMVGPGSGNTTPGGEITFTNTYNLVYHLNLPGDTTAEPGEAGKNYVLEGSDTNPTFALKTIAATASDEFNGTQVQPLTLSTELTDGKDAPLKQSIYNKTILFCGLEHKENKFQWLR